MTSWCTKTSRGQTRSSPSKTSCWSLSTSRPTSSSTTSQRTTCLKVFLHLKEELLFSENIVSKMFHCEVDSNQFVFKQGDNASCYFILSTLFPSSFAMTTCLNRQRPRSDHYKRRSQEDPAKGGRVRRAGIALQRAPLGLSQGAWEMRVMDDRPCDVPEGVWGDGQKAGGWEPFLYGQRCLFQ